MNDTKDTSRRYRFIPYRRSEIAAMLTAEASKQSRDAFDPSAFGQLVELLQATFHFEFHTQLEEMKEWYAPFNPDSQTRGHPPLSEAALSANASALADALTSVLERGNYETLTIEDVERARDEGSLIHLNVTVDFEDFEELVLFARGESNQELETRRWYLGRKRTITVPVYERVCIYVRFKADAGGKRRTGLAFEPGTAILKLFRNIPKADLEMLFPNCAIRMRRLDKFLLGVPAIAGGVPVFLKLSPALMAIAIMLGLTTGNVTAASLVPGVTGLVVLGAYLFRQWDKFKNRKVLFLKVLSENLYFRNLDNNEGVLTHLIDEAEEEESKEAMLGYAFLLWAREPLSEPDLDARVEEWFARVHDVPIDFEVADAVEKLVRFGLVHRDERLRLVPVPLHVALRRLDERWDAFFEYNTPVAESSAPHDEVPTTERAALSPAGPQG